MIQASEIYFVAGDAIASIRSHQRYNSRVVLVIEHTREIADRAMRAVDCVSRGYAHKHHVVAMRRAYRAAVVILNAAA